MKRVKHISIVLLAIGLVWGCSKNNNTRINRAYHNITAHYNVFFNGNEALKAGVQKIDNAYPNDYSRILPVYKSSDSRTASTSTADMDVAILKASKLIKLHSITKKPKRRKKRTEAYKKLASKNEFNKWVDDAYLLTGKAYFYQHNFLQAIGNFSHIVRTYEEPLVKYEAFLWMIRSYCESERFTEARDLLQRLQSDSDFPKKLEGELALITADYYMKQGEYPEAVPYMGIAVKKIKQRKRRLRNCYILAQLYEETGNAEKAAQLYREVIRMSPPYDMEFKARINIAGVYRGEGDIEDLKKKLHRMLRDEKNQEFQDQIYYALGNLFYNEGNKTEGINYYRQSVATYIENGNQLAAGCITLSNIYFEDKNYIQAHAYLDTAMTVIDGVYPEYEKYAERYTSLSRVAKHLNTIVLEDSLQRIAKMPPRERDQLIASWVDEAKRKAQQMQDMASNQQMGQMRYRTNIPGLRQANRNIQGQESSFYFYNPTVVAYGKEEFTRLWGQRKLEDNWRRSNKSSVGFEEEEMLADEASPDSLQAEPAQKRIEDTETAAYYLQDVPLNDSLMAQSNERIKEAFFQSGRALKSDFSDYEGAITQLETLNERFPESQFQLISFFDLWEVNNTLNKTDRATYYKQQIIQKFPDSKYAHFLLNPNYFAEQEAHKDSMNRLYDKAFYLFRQRKFEELENTCEQLLLFEPDTVLTPKIHFLKAIAHGKQQTAAGFSGALQAFVNAYPKSEPAPLAQQMITLMGDSTLNDYQKLVEMGYINEEIVNEELLPENDLTNDEFGGKFVYDDDLLHYFVITYPSDAEVDINRLKFDIANYNIDHYTKLDFDIETAKLNQQTEMVVVRSLTDKEQALIYFRSIIRKRDVFKTLTDVNYVNFVASSTNYREIVSDKSYFDYLKYYVKNYSRYISSDFPEEELEASAEELMAKAEEEDELEEEKGRFVVVNAGKAKQTDKFIPGNNLSHMFVIAVFDKEANLSRIAEDFKQFNKPKEGKDQLKVSIRQIDDSKLMVVKGLKNTEEAMRYFREAVSYRKLFGSLGMARYRNFVISSDNFDKLTNTSKIEEYMTFFREYYIRGKWMNPSPSSSTQPVKETPEKVTPQVKPAQQPAVAYDGPFIQSNNKSHLFALVVPSEGIDIGSVVTGINQLNTAEFANLKLSVTAEPIDFRTVIVVKGLKNGDEAVSYMKKIVTQRDIYRPLENTQYRNFVISTDNYRIFRENKNIRDYMDFYKLFYLKK